MPQLEVFLFGDQFLCLLVLYVSFFFIILVIEYSLINKLLIYNVFHDGLSVDNLK